MVTVPGPDGGVQINLTGDEARLAAAEVEPGGLWSALLLGCINAVVKSGNPLGIDGDPRELIRAWNERQGR